MTTSHRLALVATLIISADRIQAQDAETRRLDVYGFVDGYYAYNFNRPTEDQENFFPGVGTTAKDDSEFAINLAQVDFVLAPAPVGFHVALGFGRATDVVHAAEPESWEHVVQASIQYATGLGRGLLLEGGIYPSHIGFEAFASKDNWNYTRSWLGELSPYYQTGVKASYPLSEHWSTQLHLLNGWQQINDVNRGKSVGWQFAYAADRLSFSFNGLVGPEQANNDDDLRALVDSVMQYKLTPALTLGASADVATEEQPGGEDAEWYGVGLYMRFARPESRTAVALRGESYDDDDGAISGTPQTLREITATFEVRPVERLIVKLEGRYDHSSAPVFADEEEQLLLVAGVVATF